MSKPTKTKKIRWWIILTLFLVGLIILLAVMIIAPGVQASSNVNMAQSDITTLTAGIKNYYRNQDKRGRYLALSIQDLLRQRVPPAAMIDGEFNNRERQVLDFPWGDVHVFPVNDQMQRAEPYDLFVIGYENVPQAECIKLIHGLMPNFYAIFIGTRPHPSQKRMALSKNPSDAVKNCTLSETVYVDFVGK